MGRRLFDIDRPRALVVAVDERVDDELAHRVRGVVLERELNPAGNVERADRLSSVDQVDQLLDCGENAAALAGPIRGLGPGLVRCWYE